MNSSDIHIRAISQQMLKPSFAKICLKTTCLKFHPNFQGTNELMTHEHKEKQWNTIWLITVFQFHEQCTVHRKTKLISTLWVTERTVSYLWLNMVSEWENKSHMLCLLSLSCWRHQIETLSALLALCARYSAVTGEFPTQRPVTLSFDVFFDLGLNRRLS